MAAALGKNLVFDVKSGDSRLFEFAHGSNHVHGIAIAGVGIGDDRKRGCANNLSDPLQNFREGEKAEIGQSHAPGDASAGGVNNGKARFFNEQSAQAVESPGSQQNGTVLKQRTETGACVLHWIRREMRMAVSYRKRWLKPREPLRCHSAPR